MKEEGNVSNNNSEKLVSILAKKDVAHKMIISYS